MPTISTTKDDLEALLGRSIEPEPLRQELLYAKAELKSWEPAEKGPGVEVKIELNDTNRPDTWTPEGIARQLKLAGGGEAPSYPFLEAEPEGVVQVDPSLESIRPYIGAFLAKGPAIDDDMLKSLIQTQEKLSDTFGRKRKDLAAGIYKLAGVQFPVSYGTIAPNDEGFVPLGEDKVMTPKAILAEHPKGQEYASTLESFERYPILRGKDGTVLSMPPIINSNDVGQVEVGDTEFFVECTATSAEILKVGLNIMAADMSDRGFTITPVTTETPYENTLGPVAVHPRGFEDSVEMKLSDVDRGLGLTLPEDEIRELFSRFGLELANETGEGRDKSFVVRAPFYRNDLLHPMDVVEDVAICRGYDSFPRVMPTAFTVGRLTPIEILSQTFRQRLVGFGFQEMACPVLTLKEKLTEKMSRDDSDLVEILNPMSENFGVIRNRILPSLLEVEAQSYQAKYPHRIFESGETAQKAPETIKGSHTHRRVAAIISDKATPFSEIHSVVDGLLLGMGLGYRLEAVEEPGFMPGRTGKIVLDSGVTLGILGEIHPETLEAWGIKMPVAAFELDLETLL